MDQIKYQLNESDIPRQWYNVAADMPNPVKPPLHPGTGQPTNTIGLEVEDTFGATHATTTTLTIYNNKPTASFTANPNPAACCQDITFDPSGSSHGHPDRSIISYEWDFDYDG